jgi:hypothetical protein
MGHVADSEDLRSEFKFIFACGSATDDPPLVSATVLFALTLIVTSYRCFSRYSKRIWGRDDSVTLFSSLVFALFVIGSYNPWFKAPVRSSGLTLSLPHLRYYPRCQR